MEAGRRTVGRRSRLRDMAEDLDALYQLTHEEAKQALSNHAG
jgi:hypothetical protein